MHLLNLYLKFSDYTMVWILRIRSIIVLALFLTTPPIITSYFYIIHIPTHVRYVAKNTVYAICY